MTDTIYKVVELGNPIPDWVFSAGKFRALRAKLDQCETDEWATFIVAGDKDEVVTKRNVENVRTGCHNFMRKAPEGKTHKMATRSFLLNGTTPPDISAVLKELGANDGDWIVQAKKVRIPGQATPEL